jgi:hypothetical protein
VITATAHRAKTWLGTAEEYTDLGGLLVGAGASTKTKWGARLGARGVTVAGVVVGVFSYWSGKDAERQKSAANSIQARMSHLAAIQDGSCKGP